MYVVDKNVCRIGWGPASAMVWGGTGKAKRMAPTKPPNTYRGTSLWPTVENSTSREREIHNGSLLKKDYQHAPSPLHIFTVKNTQTASLVKLEQKRQSVNKGKILKLFLPYVDFVSYVLHLQAPAKKFQCVGRLQTKRRHELSSKQRTDEASRVSSRAISFVDYPLDFLHFSSVTPFWLTC